MKQQQLISRKLSSAAAAAAFIKPSTTTGNCSPPEAATMVEFRKSCCASFLAKRNLSGEGIARLMIDHPMPCLFALSLLFFMGVEYTLQMVPASSPPVDVGFHLTEGFHEVLSTRPTLNSFLAAINTVFVGMQVVYIGWTLVAERRPRPTVAALFMFTCRGILGYCTQLPLPEGFLGSGADFPVGNVSFFLFFSGHVGGAVIASLDMRRMERKKLAWTFDVLNLLQAVRLLAMRGHYTIDLAAGLGAGFLCDVLARSYLNRKDNLSADPAARVEIRPACCNCSCN